MTERFDSERHHDLRLLRRRLPPRGARRATARSPRSARRSTGPPTRATPASRAASRTSSRRRRDRLTDAADPRGAASFRLATLGGGDRPDRVRADADQGRPRAGRDRRPRLLARDERGLLRDAAPDARRDRHQQHRQLLARLPLADVVRAAQVARPLGRDRLVHRLRPRRRDDPDRREPDRGPPGRRRADQAGDAARA